MKVVFLSPGFPTEMRHFTRGLAEVGATVIGAADQPEHALPAEVRRHLSGYVQLPGYADERAACDALVRAVGHLDIDRVEALWEPLVLLAARVREALGIPGMSRDTVLGFRDKQVMKERAATGGCRVPRSVRASTTAEVHEAAERIGFPVVVKPIAGAGTATTWRVDSRDELAVRLSEMHHVEEVSVEEFVVGEEFTWDVVTVGGRPVFDSITQYHPPPLVARNEEWVSPAQLTLRDPHIDALQSSVALGHRVLAALGMGTGFCHMEWFRTASGEAVLGEIACRPGGGRLMDGINWANDLDIYREWARVACWHSFEAPIARRYHVGVVFKRAQGQGRIVHIEGADAARHALGEWLVGVELLPIGAPRRDWKQTVVSDGMMAVRHPDYDTCRSMMERLVQEVKLYAG